MKTTSANSRFADIGSKEPEKAPVDVAYSVVTPSGARLTVAKPLVTTTEEFSMLRPMPVRRRQHEGQP